MMTPTISDSGTQANPRPIRPAPPAAPAPASTTPTAQTAPTAPTARPRTDASARAYYVGSSRRLGPVAKVIGTVLGLVLLFAGAKYVVDSVGGEGKVTGAVTGSEGQLKFENGRIPAKNLVTIDGDFQLLPKPADAFADLRAALESAGHTTTVNSAYRDVVLQEELVAKYGLLEDGGTAAPVGQSEHGLGATVDLTLDFEALNWMRENAGKFGFKETIDTEPWHWTFVQ